MNVLDFWKNEWGKVTNTSALFDELENVTDKEGVKAIEQISSVDKYYDEDGVIIGTDTKFGKGKLYLLKTSLSNLELYGEILVNDPNAGYIAKLIDRNAVVSAIQDGISKGTNFNINIKDSVIELPNRFIYAESETNQTILDKMWEYGNNTPESKELGGIFTKVSQKVHFIIEERKKDSDKYCFFEGVIGTDAVLENGVEIAELNYNTAVNVLVGKNCGQFIFKFHTHPKDSKFIQPPSKHDIKVHSFRDWEYPYSVVVSGLNGRMYFYDNSGIVATLKK